MSISPFASSSLSPFATSGLTTGLPTGLGTGLGAGLTTGSLSPQPVFSNFYQTGIASLTGGYAYPPGSDMVKFMDDINNTVAAASSGPSGGSIVDWANGLAAQAQQRQALAAQQAAASASSMMGGAGGTGGGLSGLMQMYQMLMSMMGSLQGQSGTGM